VSAVLELSHLIKDYRGLRPLRVNQFVLADADRIAILGLDRPAAETLINLVTGAALPDSGEVRVFGRRTADITESADWLAVVDRFGIVTERAVLLDALSALQNLALPFSLDIEPPPDDVRRKAIALAREVGLADADLERAAGALDGLGRARLRLGRALALAPKVLLLEHATASVARASVSALASDVRRAAAGRRIATLTFGADEEFASAVADRVLTLDPATGQLAVRRRRWFR
jgi:predicted ABC-type transport system involved in lysophospholipase L1 biosynthesis ATPase subunit